MKITIKKEGPPDNPYLTFSDIADTPGIYVPFGLPNTRIVVFNNYLGAKCFHLYLGDINKNGLEILEDSAWISKKFLKVNEKIVITFDDEI